MGRPLADLRPHRNNAERIDEGLLNRVFSGPSPSEFPHDSHFGHPLDKHQALREIFAMTDPEAFMARSGWRPGMALD